MSTALNKRKIDLIKRLNTIANEHKNKLKNTNKDLNQKYSQSKKRLEDCHTILQKPLEIQQMASRKNTVLSLSKAVNNCVIPNVSNDEYRINVSINKNI